MKHPIIAQLRMERRIRDISQDALAMSLDRQQHSMSCYEREVVSPSLETLEKWANALGFDLVLKKRGET